MTSPPAAISQQEVRSLVKRLQGRYPAQTRDIDPAELLRRTREALALCPALEITDEKDVFRFIALSVLITDEQKRSKLVEGVTRRILANLDWDSEKRLDFLYKHLVGRPVSPDEMDFGPTFIPGPPTPV
jgi:hypothetical protein